MVHPRRYRPSIRSHLLFIVLVGAILPLGLVGLWLTRSGIRSGQSLLEAQLSTSLHGIEQSIAARWDYRRSDMLLLANNEAARSALSTGVVTAADSAYFERTLATVAYGVSVFSYHDRAGRELYTSPPRPTLEASQLRLVRDTAEGFPRRTMILRMPVSNEEIVVGQVVAEVYLDAVIPATSENLLLPGSALAVRDRTDGTVLVPLTNRVEFPSGRKFVVNGDRWSAASDSLAEPPFDLAVAGPVAPYVTPFERAGHLGLAALTVVALLALVLSSVLSARLAESFRALADAAGAVAGGDLSRRVDPGGPAEFERLAGSFNAMTQSVRGLVAELSQRRALAAVGQFAASLSHEVRNALTSVQIDLERVDERSEDPKNRILVSRTLAHVRRLDAAVTGSLRIARSGSVAAVDVNLGDVLRESIRIAEPTFSSSGARVTTRGIDEDLVTRGDLDALHQLFLNLLLNAQQASPDGETDVAVHRGDGRFLVSITDTGIGMTPAEITRAFDPFYTTRAKGTGLGLPIARQIAIAHAGEVTIRSTPGIGTTIDVSLPCVRPPDVD